MAADGDNSDLNVIDPLAQNTQPTLDTSIADLIQESGKEKEFIQGSMQDIVDTGNILDSITKQRKVALNKAAKDNAVVVGTKESGALLTQEAVRGFVNRHGYNVENPDNIIDGLETERESTVEEMNKRYDTMIKREQDAGSNIFARIGARFQNKQDAKVLKLQADKADLLETNIQAINQNVQAMKKSQDDISPVTSAAAVEAATRLAATTFQDKALEVSAQNQLSRIDQIKTLFSMSESALGNDFQLHNAEALQAQRDFQHQQALLIAEQRRLMAQQKEEDLNAERTMVSAAKYGLGTLGKGNEASTLPPSKIVQLVKNGEFKEAYDIGMSKLANPDQPAKIANDPATALGIIDKYNATLPNEMTPVITAIRHSVAAVAENPQNAGLKPQELQFKINQQTKADADAYQNNIKYEDNSNPYQSFNLPTLLKIRGLNQNKFVSDILAPEVKNGLIENDPQRVVDLAMKAVEDKKISFNDAVIGIHLIYKSAANLNNISKNYGAAGYPVQTGYRTGVKIETGILAPRVKIDLADTVEVNNMLARKLNPFGKPSEKLLTKPKNPQLEFLSGGNGGNQ